MLIAINTHQTLVSLTWSNSKSIILSGRRYEIQFTTVVLYTHQYFPMSFNTYKARVITISNFLFHREILLYMLYKRLLQNCTSHIRGSVGINHQQLSEVQTVKDSKFLAFRCGRSLASLHTWKH